MEQADRCDWEKDKNKAARDVILFQLEDIKLKKKILAENTPLEQVLTSWDCTGPSSAQTGTGTLIYFIQDLLHIIDKTC